MFALCINYAEEGSNYSFDAMGKGPPDTNTRNSQSGCIKSQHSRSSVSFTYTTNGKL